MVREQAKLLASRVGKDDGAVVLLQCQLDFELHILRENKKIKYDFEATLKSANFANDSKFEIQLESKLMLAWFYFHKEKFRVNIQKRKFESFAKLFKRIFSKKEATVTTLLKYAVSYNKERKFGKNY